MSKNFDAARVGTGTKEWAEVVVNIQRGCSNGCLYCYAAANAARFGLCAREDWTTEVLVKKAEITSFPAKPGVVMFPSAHDITEFNVDAYIRVARLILAKGNSLLIVTKPRPGVMNHVMRELAPWREQVLLRYTIGATGQHLTNLWEPGAPLPIDRLDALCFAEDLGFRRSVSIEPMLGGYDETMKVVENCLPWSPETIWIGKMNKLALRVVSRTPEIQAAVDLVLVQQSDAEILRLYAELKGLSSVRWKDSIKEVVARLLPGEVLP